VKQRLAVIALGMALAAVPAYPCGGPGADLVGLPLVPVQRFLARTLYEDEYEVRLRSELRFLDPFHRAHPDSIGSVYRFAYEGEGYGEGAVDDTVRQRIDRESLRETRAAIARGAYANAVVEARRVVDQVLEMPAGVATPYREVLRTAVEVIDIAPRLTPGDRDIAARYFSTDSVTRQALGSTPTLPPVLREAVTIRSLPRDSAAAYLTTHPSTPRRASLRCVALQEAMRTGIPDGWAASIADSVPPAKWTELERLHDSWLRDFGSHPLADYVRFSKVRLFYFKGDRDRAWNELLDFYPRRRQRVLGEMRYLVYQGSVPSSLDDPRIDWLLRTALLMTATVTPEQWNAYWRTSEARRDEPWAIALQERLLWQAVRLVDRSRSLPAAFPQHPAAPSGLWAKLRLLALLGAGDIDAALTQADTLEAFSAAGGASAEGDVALIRTRLHLLRRDWGRAIATAPNDENHAPQYLVRVLAPPDVVDSVARASDSPFARDALIATLSRLARAGDWAGASRLASTTGDATFARRWARTATLAADATRAGRLAFARWMRDQHGALFFGESTYWLRGLNWRRDALAYDTAAGSEGQGKLDRRLPWTPDEERQRIEAHLHSTTELYYALQAYSSWLEGATSTTPRLSAVVREADVVYNRLVNWDAGNSRFWSETLETSREARAIRRAGRFVQRR